MYRILINLTLELRRDYGADKMAGTYGYETREEEKSRKASERENKRQRKIYEKELKQSISGHDSSCRCAGCQKWRDIVRGAEIENCGPLFLLLLSLGGGLIYGFVTLIRAII